MDTTKTRIQGNAVVVTIPKSLGIRPGVEYRFSKGENGTLVLTPTKKVPETMEELFKDWHGQYKTPDDLQDWDDLSPEGEEMW